MKSEQYNELKAELVAALQLIENLGTQLTGLTSVLRVIALTHPDPVALVGALADAQLRLEAVYGEAQLSDQTIQNTLAPIVEFQQLLSKPQKPLESYSPSSTS